MMDNNAWPPQSLVFWELWPGQCKEHEAKSWKSRSHPDPPDPASRSLLLPFFLRIYSSLPLTKEQLQLLRVNTVLPASQPWCQALVMTMGTCLEHRDGLEGGLVPSKKSPRSRRCSFPGSHLHYSSISPGARGEGGGRSCHFPK